ncbi:Sodium/calcium exchanger membrane region protein [Oceanicola granulosus HTCC2516]|uniref:Sodium/calcium exchanger membrane region protein n=1 Tax=Oceanicola granulosus (strain ATCC BAA-861 / DSM 15982 / KCTC 12143 / HTCC2516) TaxID=314256 RepID=Q2CEL9_OCEGH|nr:sodium:calcium antiporter [Oceanicola granulosus]EAR51113.1 Sodium/calcium exchanger membrane region protein [Oceanicola granulosus HTCC2516]
MPDLSNLPLWPTTLIFLASAVAIALAGWRLSGVADELADRTGMGEVVAGALFVGAATSLPGAITSVSTAAQDAPDLAVGNALGGLTAQTAFIAVADIFYRRANLEHAAASVTGLAQGALLVVLLTVPLIASTAPSWTFWGIHPATIGIPLIYGFGLRLLGQIQETQLWEPVQTDETREQISETEDKPEGHMRSLWVRFLVLAGITAVAGYTIGESSLGLVELTPLDGTGVGTVFAGVANSLPELVTAIAAVRMGAVSLAMGDVIGGNAFEVMFLAAADVVHDGSIYAEIDATQRGTALIAITMTGVLLLGMLRRQKEGFAKIGFESVIVLALYALSVALVVL